MLWVVGALVDVVASSIRKLSVPNKILSAVEPTPVPVGAHDGTDELGVILVRNVAVTARRDAVSWSCDYHGHNKGDECNQQLHGEVVGESDVGVVGLRQIGMCCVRSTVV